MKYRIVMRFFFVWLQAPSVYGASVLHSSYHVVCISFTFAVKVNMYPNWRQEGDNLFKFLKIKICLVGSKVLEVFRESFVTIV
jgi:hypothetical protein